MDTFFLYTKVVIKTIKNKNNILIIIPRVKFKLNSCKQTPVIRSNTG